MRLPCFILSKDFSSAETKEKGQTLWKKRMIILYYNSMFNFHKISLLVPHRYNESRRWRVALLDGFAECHCSGWQARALASALRGICVKFNYLHKNLGDISSCVFPTSQYK